MNFRDYFFGRPLTLRSPLHPDEIQRRIREDTKTAWWALPFRSGPVGRIRFGRLTLRYVSSVMEYNAKPILTGPVERTATGTELRLVYRGHLWSVVFFVIWYLILICIAFGLIFLGFDRELHGEELVSSIGVPAVLFVAPIIMHVIGTRNSDDELGDLLEFLERVAEARRV